MPSNSSSDNSKYSRDLLNILDLKGAELSLHSLPAVADKAEQLVRQQLTLALKHICLPTATGEDHGLVTEDDKSYEVTVQELTQDRSRLGMSIVERSIDRRTKEAEPRTIETPSSLRFQSAELWLPDGFKAHEEEVAAATIQIIRSGSVWYEDRLLSALKYSDDDLISSLYRYLHALLPETVPVSHIWFATVTKSQGHYILDPGMAALALRDSASRAINLGEGPAALLARFLNASVPVEKTWGLEAAKTGRCLDVDMKASKYRNDQADVHRAELAVFGGAPACVYPICYDGETFLIVAFSAGLKELLVPILEASKDDLTRRFKAARSRIKNIYRQVERSTLIGERAVTAARFIGALSGEFASTFLHK